MRLTDIFEKYRACNAKNESGEYFTAAPDLYDDPLDDEQLEDEDDLDLEDDDLEDDFLVEEDPVNPAVSSSDSSSDLPETVVHNEQEGHLLLSVRGLTKVYKQAGKSLNILNGVDLRIYSGEIAALVGPSGSGKSTLLHILGLLDSPTSGQIMMEERDISKISERLRTRLRSQHIGFVYQFHHLLPEFTALENVALPQIIAGFKTKDANDKAAALLEQMGLGHRLKHRPATLSGGEQQRVAIARALINEPMLLFADEPTGNLDPETSAEVFDILLNMVRKFGIGALIATHNMDLANEMDRILEVKMGRILPF